MKGLPGRRVGVGDNNDNINNLNANNQLNNGFAHRMASLAGTFSMKTYKNHWKRLCSWQNLVLAYEQAKKGKTGNPKVREFSEHWGYQLALLRHELMMKTYKPLPLQKFILRDPKTRTICVSNFRDRVIHHALVNILQPIFEPRFIYDSYASRKEKGTLPAIKRFDTFKNHFIVKKYAERERERERELAGYVFKVDIYHYFETVDHTVLLNILARYIKDEDVLWLVKIILENYSSTGEGKGMPLGNWTSQFFANIYLNELDQFVKHQLKAKYYIRYVDDFVILHHSKKKLQEYEREIREFLKMLKIELHPTKCNIAQLRRGTSFLGFRIFLHHKLVRQRNLRKIKSKLNMLLENYENNITEAETVLLTLRGWNAYAMHGNTYKLRANIMAYVEDELVRRTAIRKKIREKSVS